MPKKVKNINNKDFIIQALLKHINPIIKSKYLYENRDENRFCWLFKEDYVAIYSGRIVLYDKFGIALSSISLNDFITNAWLGKATGVIDLDKDLVK